MADFFSSGFAALFVLALMLIEGIVLTVVFRRTGKGMTPLDVACSLAAGAGLVMALFAALVGAHWGWIAAALALSLLGHVCDVWRRSINAESGRQN